MELPSWSPWPSKLAIPLLLFIFLRARHTPSLQPLQENQSKQEIEVVKNSMASHDASTWCDFDVKLHPCRFLIHCRANSAAPAANSCCELAGFRQTAALMDHKDSAGGYYRPLFLRYLHGIVVIAVYYPDYIRFSNG